MHILNNALCDWITCGSELKHLLGSDTFRPGSCNAPDGRFRLRVFYRETNHGARNRLCRCNRLKVSKAATRTLWPIFLDHHMPYFARRTGCPMINLTIDHQASSNTTSQAHIQHNAFSPPLVALHCGSTCRARLHFCQCRRIGIVIYYTRYIKFLLKILLQGEIVPALCMVQCTYYPSRSVYQATNGNPHAQDPPVAQSLRDHYLSKHFIKQPQDGFGIGNML